MAHGRRRARQSCPFPRLSHRMLQIISFVGATIFILIQLVLLIDFAATWNESWVAAFETSGDRKWVFLLLGTVITFYVGTIVITALLYGAPALALSVRIWVGRSSACWRRLRSDG